MIKTAIIGGAGYTAGELLRLVLNHKEVELTSVHSNSQAGKLLSTIHTDLVGNTDLTFSSSVDENADIYFICRGHGQSKTFLDQYPQIKGKRIIDLSRDYRLQAGAERFVYGLPELNKSAISAAQHIANPGCFATAIQLALLPLAAVKGLQNDIHIHGLTGSTGAGQAPISTTHFSWRNNNVSVYKAFGHQHMDEVNQTVLQLQPTHDKDIHFVPVRGNFARGIFISAYTKTDQSEEALVDLYQQYYKDHPFTHVTTEEIHLKSVVNTNKCLLQVRKQKGMVHIISTIDNLLKGASGQAVQNMNLSHGLPEDQGLRLKSSMF